jgi:dienelactone hydrolase
MPLGRLVLLAVALASAAPAPKIVSFKTPDGWTIAANYRPAKPGRATMILAHGVGSARGEWNRFAERLALDGVGTLAIDLRGHADSQSGPKGKTEFTSFDESGEWPRAVADLRAAGSWLKTKGVPDERVAFGGASIGANLASVAAAESTKTPFLLLLSPGGDYRGARLAARNGLKTLACASAQDQYAYSAVHELERRGLAAAVYAPAGHGVQLFDDPATQNRIAQWVTAAARLKDSTPKTKQAQ